MFFSFGLWNVLLLPFSIPVLGATEFEYGLQEGLTSVGFVVGSFFMARFSSLLPEPTWIVLSHDRRWASAASCTGSSSQVGVAIVMVMISGFFNSPSSVARSVLLQRNTPREMRGRVFSAFYVMRDVIFLIGMAGAGLADIVDIRLLIVVASSLLFVSAGLHARRPRPRRRDVGRRLGSAARRDGGAGARAAPAGRDAGRLRPARRPARRVRAAVARAARGLRARRDGPRGAGRHAHRRARGSATSAYFILDGSTTAGMPEDDGFRGLSTMAAGDFFGEIAALTGSLRTADVVADVDTTLLEVPAEALRATMVVPDIQHLVFSTLTSRLVRTESADLPRLAGIDQAALRDLRTPRPSVEALPRTYEQPRRVCRR